jgi:hypothetical protein
MAEDQKLREEVEAQSQFPHITPPLYVVSEAQPWVKFQQTVHAKSASMDYYPFPIWQLPRARSLKEEQSGTPRHQNHRVLDVPYLVPQEKLANSDPTGSEGEVKDWYDSPYGTSGVQCTLILDTGCKLTSSVIGAESQLSYQAERTKIAGRGGSTLLLEA